MESYPAVTPAVPKRVLMLSTSYPPTPGAPSGPFVHRLAARLVAAGCEVTVVAPAGDGAQPRVEDGVRSVFFRYAPSRFERIAHGDGIAYNVRARPVSAVLVPGLMAAFAAAAARHAGRAEVVHAHWLPSALAARTTRLPRVVTVHGSDLLLADRFAPLVRRAIAGASLITVNEQMAARLRALAPAAAVRVIAPDGVDADAAPYGLAQPNRVLFVGRLVEIKGVDVLVAAWRSVRAAIPDAVLEIVGDGPLRGSLAGEGIELTGHLPHGELAARYERAAVVAIPSRRDSFAIACLEAMAAGRPVVATAVGEMADRVRDGIDGIVVPVGDRDALARALVRLLGDAAEAAAMGVAGRARVVERYRWDAIVAATLEAYSSARSKRGA